MAIEKKHKVIQYGIDINESYHRVNNIMINNQLVDYVIEIYISKEARYLNSTPVDAVYMNGIPFHVIMTAEGDDIIAKVYNFSKKAIPEYRNKEELIDV